MKPPFIRYADYIQGLHTLTDEEMFSSKQMAENLANDSFVPIPVLKDRSSIIIENFHNKFFKLHNGKTYIRLKALNLMTGFRFGQFVFPKKLGKSIHDSKRNAKKREKLRRKITQKKARRSSPSPKSNKAKIGQKTKTQNKKR